MSEKLLKHRMKRKLIFHNFIENVQHYINILTGNDWNLHNKHFMNSLPNMQETQLIMRLLLQNNHPFLLLRFGLYEYLLCYQYLEKKCGIRKIYSDFIRYHIAMDAGISNNDEKSLDSYCSYIISQLYMAEIMAYWRDMPYFGLFQDFYSKEVQHINVDNLYPFPFLHKDCLPSWQQELKGKRILFVSSFSKTIKSQYQKRTKLWEQADLILPEMELLTYQSVVTNGGQTDSRFSGWHDAVKYMAENILEQKFDIVFISAGGYGIPLAITLKKAGCRVIQWGGCFQLWFGIMGGRWLNDPEINAYRNSSWVFPSKEETPPLFSLVNDSSYWNPSIM